MCSRVMASSAPKGSSIISTSGSSASARAIDTRWRMPPDSCAGYRSAAYSRPTRRSSSSARRVAARAAPRPPAPSANRRSPARSSRASAPLPGTPCPRAAAPPRPAARQPPNLAAGRRHQSGEHLQQRALAAARRADDGVNEPFAMSMSMSLNTRTQPARVSKSTFRPRARICAARGAASREAGPGGCIACMSWPASTRGHGRREPAAARCAPSIAADAPARAWDGEFQAAAHQRRQAMSAREKASPATGPARQVPVQQRQLGGQQRRPPRSVARAAAWLP